VFSGLIFFSLGENLGKLQPFCGSDGGLVSDSEGAAGAGDPHRLCGLSLLSCLAGCRRCSLLYLFLGMYVGEVKSDAAISGLRGLSCM